MATITIDGVDYDTDKLTEEAKAQLMSMQFCDGELQRLQAEAMSIQTARNAYAVALSAELQKIREGGAAEKPVEASSKESGKKGLLGGLFGKK